MPTAQRLNGVTQYLLLQKKIYSYCDLKAVFLKGVDFQKYALTRVEDININ